MGWDATLRCQCCRSLLNDQGYSTNAMINTALSAVYGHEMLAWPQALQGLSGKDAAQVLAKVVIEIVTNLGEYQKMTPENGWGDELSLIDVLFAMLRASVQFQEAEWEVFG